MTLRRRSITGMERTDDRAYDLRQRLNRAVNFLRDAEDIARLEMPASPTADRIRDIYEQVSDDVLNGRTSVPPLKQRLAECEAECAWRKAAMGDAKDALAEGNGKAAWNALNRHETAASEGIQNPHGEVENDAA